MFSRISAKSLRAFYGEVLPATESAQSFRNAFVRRLRHVSRILIKGWNPCEIFAVPDWSRSMNPAQVLRKIFPSSKRHFEMSKRCRSEKWMFGVVVWGQKKETLIDFLGNLDKYPAWIYAGRPVKKKGWWGRDFWCILVNGISSCQVFLVFL